MSESMVAKEKVQIYLGTDYRVDGDKPFTLNIGQASEPHFQLCRQHRCDCTAFVTACNPFREQRGERRNADRHAQLIIELTRRSLSFIEDGEPSCLVLGLALEAPRTLGRRFHQNGVVWCDQEANQPLALLR